jgi:hypothetical protein
MKLAFYGANEITGWKPMLCYAMLHYPNTVAWGLWARGMPVRKHFHLRSVARSGQESPAQGLPGICLAPAMLCPEGA